MGIGTNGGIYERAGTGDGQCVGTDDDQCECVGINGGIIYVSVQALMAVSVSVQALMTISVSV